MGLSGERETEVICSESIQHYLVGIIGIATPSEVITAIHALMDFQYHVQAYHISNTDIHLISASLDEFHANKHAILEHGRRQGKGNKIINNWYIPKLELMQSIVPSIKCVGATIQWTADTTEHAHVSKIKTPARSTTNNNYDPQICCYLDCTEKCRAFELATSLCEQQAMQDQCGFVDDGRSEEEKLDASNGTSDEDDPPCPLGGIRPAGLVCPVTNYFTITARLSSTETGSTPFPLHSFIAGSAVVNLSYSPSL